MSGWLPSLNALRAFEAVSRHLSYRDAAAELGVTPAAVKQQVRGLEETVGAPLMRREGRGIALTAAGTSAAGDLREAFRGVRRAVAKLRRLDQRQRLTLTVEPSFAAAWLVRRLDAFKRRHPEIDVLIDSSMRVVDLEREEADVAIRYAVAPGEAQLVHRLFDDETLAVCSPALAEGPPPLRSLADLEAVTLIHLEWMSPSFHWFDWQVWLASAGAAAVQPRRELRFNDYPLAIQAAIAGQGVVLGSWPIVRDAVESGLLVSPFRERVRLEVGYDLVATKTAMARPEVAAFVDWMLEEVAASQDG